MVCSGKARKSKKKIMYINIFKPAWDSATPQILVSAKIAVSVLEGNETIPAWLAPALVQAAESFAEACVKVELTWDTIVQDCDSEECHAQHELAQHIKQLAYAAWMTLAQEIPIGQYPGANVNYNNLVEYKGSMVPKWLVEIYTYTPPAPEKN
jgi:hypothetical protein